MKRILLILVLITCLLPAVSFAQYTPTNQDCGGAIQICSKVYTQPKFISTGKGLDSGELAGNFNYYGGSCTSSNCGCRSSLYSSTTLDPPGYMWYAVTISKSGTLAFKLTPFNATDDYNFAVYNFGTHEVGCEYLHTVNSSSSPLSCNFCHLPGPTGLDPKISVAGTNEHVSYVTGTACVSFNPVINVTAGSTYWININWFVAGSTNCASDGYTLDFTNSTAEFVDNTTPYLASAVAPYVMCSTSVNTMTIGFSEKVLSSMVNASDFSVTSTSSGPYTVSSVVAIQPAPSLVTYPRLQYYTLTYSPWTDEPQTLNLTYKGHVIDVCGNVATPTTIPVTTSYSPYDNITVSNVDLVGGNLCDMHSFKLCAPSGHTTYKWFKNGHLVQSGDYSSSGCIIVTDPESYTLSYFDSSICSPPPVE